MTNFLQYSHKMLEYQFRDLDGMNSDLVLEKIAEIAGQYGAVQTVKKMGEENYQNNLLKMYLISFEKTRDAMNAAYALEGKMFDKNSMVLLLH